MDLYKLLKRLEAEAVEKEWEDRRQVMQSKPLSKTEANISTAAQLRRKTLDMQRELESNRQLAAETKRHQEAALALYRSNSTPAGKKRDDEDMQRIAVHYSSLCAEASPTWREEASIAFRNRKL